MMEFGLNISRGQEWVEQLTNLPVMISLVKEILASDADAADKSKALETFMFAVTAAETVLEEQYYYYGLAKLRQIASNTTQY